MTIAEKIEKSRIKTIFTLYREGLFYKCFNEDAMVFVKKVKNYKVSVKFVKSVGATIYSIGFPISEVEKEKLSLNSISEKIRAEGFDNIDENIVFLLEDIDIKSGFKEWAETIQKEKNDATAKKPESFFVQKNGVEGVLNMIRNFDLANSTPMKGLNFIQQLKSELNRLDKENGNF